MAESVNPTRPTDDGARNLAQDLVRSARIAALAVIDAATGAPFVSRIAVGMLPGGHLATLVSELSLHTRALQSDPRCCLLLGDPGDRGDPLNHPRLSLTATARFLHRDEPVAMSARRDWLVIHPKAKLYVDFADFAFVLFKPLSGALNGGFGKAYSLAADELGIA